MRKLYSLLFLLLNLTAFVEAQQYGNEWINYSQRYFTFKIYQDGLYRIDSTTLSNAGIDLTTVDPRSLQIFGRQKEQPIYVFGENDGVFNSTDYIELVAFKNDGWLDSIVYHGADNMSDLYYSNYNDTATYYITYNSSLSNMRAKPYSDTTYSSYSLDNYFFKSNYIKYNSEYYLGPTIEGASVSDFTPGEGWVSNKIQGIPGGINVNVNVPTPNVYTGPGAPSAILQGVAVTASNAIDTTGSFVNHHVVMRYGSSSTIFLDTLVYGYVMLKKTIPVSPTELGASTDIGFGIVDDRFLPSDIINISSATIKYPHATNLSGASTYRFEVPYNTSQAKTNYSIVNVGAASPIVYISGDTTYRTNGTMVGSTLNLLVPNAPSTKNSDVHIFNAPSSVTSVKAYNGTGFFTNYGALMVSDAYLIITHPVLQTAAQQYADYRASAPGGSFNTVIANINELYDQFAAGIYKHSLASRRFCDYLRATWPTQPRYLFLIGKSIREASEGNSGSAPGTRKNVSNYSECLVPSFGYPASDIRITAGLGSTLNLEPLIPTGRIAAQSETEVLDYLNKMIEFEAAQQNMLYTKTEKDWMKQILEFGGGGNIYEQEQFKAYLERYQYLLEDSAFGGNAKLFFKQSSDPIDPVDFQEVNNRLNDGVSLMLFFGHGSIGGFDQNIDEVTNWQNQGKYPLLIGNSCFSGDIHQPGSISVSEDFTLIPDKGVIGFLATVKQGFVATLHTYSDTLMHRLSTYDYGKSIGDQIKNTIRGLTTGIPIFDPIGYIPYEEVYTGMTLHGDPAMKINPHSKPELVIENSDVYITPENITLATDSMEVNLVVTNLGKGTNQTYLAKLTRTFPNGNDSVYIKYVDGVLYKDTVTFKIPVYHSIAFGVNQFEITIDLENPVIEEVYDEVFNNQISFNYTINGNSIYPVYPYNYSIIPDSIVEVKASTIDPFASPRIYRFEIDTTDLYNSPIKRYALVTTPGGVVTVPHNQWILQATGVNSPLVHTDSTVYFWRVSPDSSVYIWEEFSYQFIPGKTGWGQAHYFQFKNNNNSHLIYDRPNRKWDFETINEVVKVDVFGDLSFSYIEESYATSWYVNGQWQDGDGISLLPTIFVGVIDPYEPDPWHTYDGNACTLPSSATNIKYFGQYNCRPITGMGRCRGEYYFGFWQHDPVQMDSLYSMIMNKIPCGHYFVMYSYNYGNFDEWDTHSTQLYSMMNSLGVDSIYPGRENAPFIVMGRKCDPASIKYIIGDTISSDITLSDTINGILPGLMSSTTIGPAREWNSLYWKQHALESSSITGDTARLSVYGITAAGVEVKLADTLFSEYDSVLNLNSIVDANIYPYMRLRATTEDVISLTPTLFERWQVLYTPVPEAALSPSDGFYISLADSVQEGDHFNFAVAIKNISPYDMDSLLVHYWVEDENRIRHYITYSRQDSLKSGEILYDTIQISTLDYPGDNLLWVEANPVPLSATNGLYDQLEQYHFNNIGRIPFRVNADNINPILDVTFDGRHILNGDVVSAKPFVVMSLDDENQFLIMNQPADTSRFVVKLIDPNGTSTRVYFNQGSMPVLNFIPAGSDNKCKIEWNASFPIDGTYTLKVRAWDKSDNRSGGEEYSIQFEVINKQTVTHVMNYPNPFSTKTHFVFTLTGSELPQYMKIQIFNVSGKVVREIGMEELGPLYIGKNITEYAWDGKDEFGDQLANGVYFYRVFTKDGSKTDIEHRESGADQYFRKGFGKMYLMR